MEIKGKTVVLVPIIKQEKDEFYNLATQSEGSSFWYDEAQKARRTKEVFFKEWKEDYFNPSSIEKGQCFWIVVNKEKIGQIASNEFDLENKKVELDILIGQKKNMGKGYGSDALKTLMKYLFENFDINKIWTSARANNARALKTYEKVGFKKEGLLREDDYFENNFVDCVRFGVLKKEFI